MARALGRTTTGAVVLVGAPGIGKTRLLVEAEALGRAAGFDTERVTATRAASTIPFGAVAQLLPPARAAVERADLLRQVGQHLEARGGARPVLLLVDDAHLLDDASAALVHQLVVGGAAFLVATQRTDAEAPDAISTLWKDEIAERVEVGPLTGADVAALVADLLAGPAAPDLVRQVVAAAGGNPLYVVQLLDAARRDGLVRRVGGAWHLDGPLPIPDGLAAAVEERLAVLGVDDRQLLELVALGEPLDVDVLEAIAGPSGAERLEALERTGLLLAEPSGAALLVRLAHPLYAEVLRDRTPTAGRRRAQAALADAVEAAAGTGAAADPLRIAGWRLGSGADLAPALALQAAHEARRRGDFGLSVRLAQAAVDGGGGYDAHIAIALAKTSASEADGILVALATAQELAASDAERAMAAGLAFDSLAYFHEDYSGAFELAARALEGIADPSWRAVIAARRAYVLVLSGLPGSLDLVDAELAPYLDLDLEPGWPRVWVAVVAAWSSWFRGRIDEGLRWAATGRAEVERMGWVPGVPELGTFGHIEALLVAFDGRIGEARARAEADLETCAAAWSVQAVAAMHWSLAQLEVLAGHLTSAADHADRAADLYRAPGLAAMCRTVQATASALLGRPAEARALLDGLPPDVGAQPAARLAAAWCDAAEGDLAGAVAVLRRLAVEAQEVPLRLGVLVDLARVGAAVDALPQLEALVPEVGGAVAEAHLRHARAVASRRAGELHDAAVALADLGLDLLAAELAAAAEAAHRQDGRPAPAAASARLRTALLERCGGAATPALRTAAAGSTLTRRELEVATLAAAGLGNREIADRLGTSKRTVDSQLRRVYLKLGVEGRKGLERALGAAP